MTKITIALLSLIVASLLQANDMVQDHNKSLSWVDTQVKAIQIPRQGVTDTYIDSITNPFIFSYTVKKNHKVIRVRYKNHISYMRPLKLTLIINNRAMINGRWYHLQDKLRGYKIVSISASGVTLKNRHKMKILSLHTNSNNIKIHIK